MKRRGFFGAFAAAVCAAIGVTSQKPKRPWVNGTFKTWDVPEIKKIPEPLMREYEQALVRWKYANGLGVDSLRV